VLRVAPHRAGMYSRVSGNTAELGHISARHYTVARGQVESEMYGALSCINALACALSDIIYNADMIGDQLATFYLPPATSADSAASLNEAERDPAGTLLEDSKHDHRASTATATRRPPSSIHAPAQGNQALKAKPAAVPASIPQSVRRVPSTQQPAVPSTVQRGARAGNPFQTPAISGGRTMISTVQAGMMTAQRLGSASVQPARYQSSSFSGGDSAVLENSSQDSWRLAELVAADITRTELLSRDLARAHADSFSQLASYFKVCGSVFACWCSKTDQQPSLCVVCGTSV